MSSTKWVLDPTHSEIGFKVKHMMIAHVQGTFSNYSVEAETEGEDFLKSKIIFSAETASVNTNNKDRDNHLRSADFFDSEQFPMLSFSAKSYTDIDHDGSYKMTGDLTIKGITKEVTLDVEFGGIQKDPWGNIRAGFTINGKVNRKDWGLNWNAALEAGGVLVAEEVRLSCHVQLIKQ